MVSFAQALRRHPFAEELLGKPVRTRGVEVPNTGLPGLLQQLVGARTKIIDGPPGR